MSDQHNSAKAQVVITFDRDTCYTHVMTTEGMPLSLAQMMVDEAARFLDDSRKDARLALLKQNIAREAADQKIANLIKINGGVRQ